jgi:hypothetical protein
VTSSWAEVVGYSAIPAGAVLVFGLIDRFGDRRNVGPGSS